MFDAVSLEATGAMGKDGKKTKKKPFPKGELLALLPAYRRMRTFAPKGEEGDRGRWQIAPFVRFYEARQSDVVKWGKKFVLENRCCQSQTTTEHCAYSNTEKKTFLLRLHDDFYLHNTAHCNS